MAEPQDSSSIPIDHAFDSLPDSLLLLIFNSVSDAKTLIRCRAVSKRFNSLVPHSDSISLTIDSVVSSDYDDDSNSFLFGFIKSFVKSFFDLISPVRVQSESQNSPSRILRQFRRIKRLEIEFPKGDLKVERVCEVKWRAEFGGSVRSCVILIFEGVRDLDMDFMRWMKPKVFLMISTLVTAAARHHVVGEVVEEHLEMECLVLRDRGGEGVVVMEKDGLEEWRKLRKRRGKYGSGMAAERTRVPSTTVRMRHLPGVELRRGLGSEGATLVVVSPTVDDTQDMTAVDVDKLDSDVALRAFEVDDVYREAVVTIMKKGKRYHLEMNSF